MLASLEHILAAKAPNCNCFMQVNMTAPLVAHVWGLVSVNDEWCPCIQATCMMTFQADFSPTPPKDGGKL